MLATPYASKSTTSSLSTVTQASSVISDDDQCRLPCQATQGDSLTADSSKNKRLDHLSWEGITHTLRRQCCHKKLPTGRVDPCLSNVCPDELMLRRQSVMKPNGVQLSRSQVYVILVNEHDKHMHDNRDTIERASN